MNASTPLRYRLYVYLMLGCAALYALTPSCGGGGTEMETIRGKVTDGSGSVAIVCLDANANGRCDGPELQTVSDASGAFELEVAKGSTLPLVAEVLAVRAPDASQSTSAAAISYRMASPSLTYSTDITPFTTLVHASRERNFLLAEDLVRNELGLPSRFDMTMNNPPVAGSTKEGVARAIVSSLKATAATLDLSAAGALKAVIVAFPAELNVLPQLRILTKNGAPIESKEVYVDATYKLTNPAVSAAPIDLNGKIRGRGHTTWGQPKNPYKVQFSNDAAYAKVVDVLGMKKNRNWALLADYFDRSLIRNKLALSLGGSAVFADGLKWTSAGQHLEVYLNNDYVGVYLLTEDIRIDPARLDIKKMSSSASVNDVDGGYIVEVDARLDCYNGGDVNLQMVTPRSAPICIDTPDEGDITAAQLAYIKGFVLQVEEELYESNRVDKINAASFADWYLLQELFKNLDADFFSSDFMWKDTESAKNPQDRRLNMGPIWDFDRSAGNSIHYETWKSEGCWVNQPDPRVVGAGNWFSKIFDNPEFLALTLERWKLKRPHLERFIAASIDTYSRRLQPAQQRNFARWPILGQFLTNHFTFSSHAEEVAFVKQFLTERMAWLDQAYATPETFVALCKSPATGGVVIGPSDHRTNVPAP